MALNTPLSTLVRMVKSFVGDSLTIGTQSDALYKQRLADKQLWLSGEYDFPFLKNRWDVTVNPGDRFVAIPTTTIDGTIDILIDITRPFNVFVDWTANWQKVEYGIDEMTEFNYLNSDALPNWGQMRNSPVQRWQYNGSESFEIWPLPASQQIIRFVGQRVLNPLVDDADVADLDDQFLTLSVAVDLLAKKKGADVQAMLATAQERLRKLKACYPCRERSIVLGGTVRDRSWRRRVPIIGIAGSQGSGDVGPVIGIG